MYRFTTTVEDSERLQLVIKGTRECYGNATIYMDSPCIHIKFYGNKIFPTQLEFFIKQLLPKGSYRFYDAHMVSSNTPIPAVSIHRSCSLRRVQSK